MAERPTTPSGSRWEPDSDQAQSAQTPPPPDSEPTPAASPLGELAPDATEAEERGAQLRRRAGLAGAATALALGAGVTGFAIGHSTADGGHDRLSPADFSGQVPGSGRLGEGQPGPPGFGDHAWGHDGGGAGELGGLGQQPPGTGGSSGPSSSSGSGTSATAPSISGT